jgi:ATP-dependent Clp protease ATP-binding subunit ClpX
VQTHSIGFNVNTDKEEENKKHILRYVNSQDLKSFGLIPELLGRLPVVTYLNSLDNDALKLILTEPKNALVKQYKKLFKVEGIDLVIENDAVDYIVEKAMEYKLGARGLRSICEVVLSDAMFNLPSSTESTFVLTRAYAEERLDKSTLVQLKVA